MTVATQIDARVEIRELSENCRSFGATCHCVIHKPRPATHLLEIQKGREFLTLFLCAATAEKWGA